MIYSKMIKCKKCKAIHTVTFDSAKDYEKRVFTCDVCSLEYEIVTRTFVKSREV